jgi:hypothetical protein
MVGVAQLVEHWLVVPGVAGSSPVVHPQFKFGLDAFAHPNHFCCGTSTPSSPL